MSRIFLSGVVSHPPQPKTGQFLINPGVSAFLGGLQTAQTTSFCYVDVGPTPLAVSAVGAVLTATVVGGTSPALRLGIFADDGSGAYPGVVVQDAGTVALTSVAQVTASFTRLVLQPGRYWLAAKYTYTAAPTIAPQWQQITTMAPGIPGPLIATNYKGFVSATGQTAGAFSGSAPAGMSPASSGVALLGLQAA